MPFEHAFIVIIKVILFSLFTISPETERDGEAERSGLGLPSDRTGQTAGERGDERQGAAEREESSAR